MKVFAIIMVVLFVLVMVSVFLPYVIGNKTFVDLYQTYDYAIVQRYDGEQRINIAQWKDYDGEQIQIIDLEGNVWLVSSYNTILVKE